MKTDIAVEYRIVFSTFELRYARIARAIKTMLHKVECCNGVNIFWNYAVVAILVEYMKGSSLKPVHYKE